MTGQIAVMLVFGNPLGLLALAGIPAVLAIHFFQRRGREVLVSTWFLMERARREATGGRTFERLSNSLPMWLQMAAVLALAWVLSDPRQPRTGSVQRVAVVVDSSASMSVFRTGAAANLREILPALAAGASRLELTLIESAPERPRLYRGDSVDDLVTALDAWQPWAGPVDPGTTLRLARSLVSTKGTVLYLTDTPSAPPLPSGVLELAVGQPVENAGFTGVTFAEEEQGMAWKAMLRNHGRQETQRTWWLETSDGRTEPRTIRLAAGALTIIEGLFPPSAKHVRVVLSPDPFPLDDTLPLVMPAPKRLKVRVAGAEELKPLATRLIEALEEVETPNDPAAADLTLAGTAEHPAGHAILFAMADAAQGGRWLGGDVTAAPHPLMEGLQWQALLARETPSLKILPEDLILLRHDRRPLILLRTDGHARHLVFNFDPRQSNAAQLPAFVLLGHRFAQSIRQSKVARVVDNLETSQAIQLAKSPGIPLEVTACDPSGQPLPGGSAGTGERAIARPGFMTIRQGNKELLEAAVHFADPREADFKGCGTTRPEIPKTQAAIERHTRPDPLRRLWILSATALLLASWIPFHRKTLSTP